MRLVPESNEGKTNFYRSHIEAWLEHADAIGLADGKAAALEAILIEAEAALTAQRQAQQAALAATQAANNAVEKLSRYGAGALNNIRAAAVETGGIVFELAMIPAPSRKKTTLGPPTKPDFFTATLTSIGYIRLKWKCSSPNGAGGTIYTVTRQLNGRGAFEEVGTVGRKVFVDQAIPPGTTSVTYSVRPRRSTCVGEAGFYRVELANNYDLPVFRHDVRAA